MPAPPFFTPNQVTGFFGHHLWMAHYSPDRAETLQRDAGSSAVSCRQLTSAWMDTVRIHETETFDAVMGLHAPNGFRSLPDVFRDWDIPKLGRLLETVESRATFQRFGSSVRDMEWPWRWKKRLTRYELIPQLLKFNGDLKLSVTFMDAERWSVARFFAMSVYPDRFPELAARFERLYEPASVSYAGLHFRPRGFADHGNYSIWLVLERAGAQAVIDLADDEAFPKMIRELLGDSACGLTPMDVKHPPMLTLVEPSERQKRIVVESVAGISSDPRVRLRILTPVEGLPSGEKPRHVLAWNGRRYAVSEEQQTGPCGLSHSHKQLV